MTLIIFAPEKLSNPTKLLLYGKLPLNVQNVAAAFFALWWAVGASVVTFLGPHLVTGNGYFGSWTAFAGSVWLLNVTFSNATYTLVADLAVNVL